MQGKDFLSRCRTSSRCFFMQQSKMSNVRSRLPACATRACLRCGETVYLRCSSCCSSSEPALASNAFPSTSGVKIIAAPPPRTSPQSGLISWPVLLSNGCSAVLLPSAMTRRPESNLAIPALPRSSQGSTRENLRSCPSSRVKDVVRVEEVYTCHKLAGSRARTIYSEINKPTFGSC